MDSTPATVPSAFSMTSETSLSTRSGLAPGYTVTTIRYGVFTSGKRLVCMLLMDTKPSISTMMTATRTVNGFLTLNFPIISYHFLTFCRALHGKRPQKGESSMIPIIHEVRGVARAPGESFAKFSQFSPEIRFRAEDCCNSVEIFSGLCYTI